MDISAQARLHTAITQPGVLSLELWDDGIEVCGSPYDQDDQAGFVTGTFTPAEVRAEAPNYPLTDNRTAA